MTYKLSIWLINIDISINVKKVKGTLHPPSTIEHPLIGSRYNILQQVDLKM